MIEWLALLVLIPAIVIPVVLALGFAGCDIFFPLNDPASFQPTFTSTLTNDQGQQGRCIVQRIEPVRLLRSGTQVRITVQTSMAGNLVIDRLFISQAADVGDPYDSAGDLTLVASTVFVAAGTSVTLPPVDYVLDRTKPLLVAFDIGSPGNVVFLPNAPAAEASAFIGQVQEAEIPDRQPGYTPFDRIYLVELIEVA